jgi:hypothetical protein
MESDNRKLRLTSGLVTLRCVQHCPFRFFCRHPWSPQHFAQNYRAGRDIRDWGVGDGLLAIRLAAQSVLGRVRLLVDTPKGKPVVK